MCHTDASLSMTKKGRTVSLFVDGRGFASSAHSELGCVGCHEGFKPSELPHKAKISPVKCLACHEGDQFTDFAESVHGRSVKGTVLRPRARTATRRIPSERDRSGTGAPEAFAERCVRSATGRSTSVTFSRTTGVALARGVKGAPSCIDCHGEHAVQSVRGQQLHHGPRAPGRNVPELPPGQTRSARTGGPSAGFISSYETSVHGQAIKAGNDAAATCTDCHGSHDMKKGSNPTRPSPRRTSPRPAGNATATCTSSTTEAFTARRLPKVSRRRHLHGLSRRAQHSLPAGSAVRRLRRQMSPRRSALPVMPR